MNQIVAIVLLVTSLAACVGPLVPVVKVDKLPLEQRQAIHAMPIRNETQLIGKDYKILGIVEGISCKNKTWDPAATKSDAIAQAKYWAKEMGATAISNIQCDYPRGTTTTYNCWESITCTGQAIVTE